MRQVFIGGSRRISRLNDAVRQRLARIIERDLDVLIGDANGADKAVQAYLQGRGYRRVVVYCTGGGCRNNVGNWPVRAVVPPHKTKDFAYFTAKDLAMAREADAGLMLWDGESAGTIVNAARLLAAGKLTVVYVSSEESFATLRGPSDLDRLLSTCPRAVRARLDRYLAEHAREHSQAALFGQDEARRVA